MSTEMYRGFHVPIKDVHCRSVVFDTTADMVPALECVKKFDVALQAGGNFGVWPAYLAKRFESVVTAEPDPLNYSCLIENVPKNVQCIRTAFGQGTSTIGMVRDEKNAGAHYVNERGDEGIPMIPIDSLRLPACDYICLDVEGYEMNALKGAWGTIRDFHPVIQIEDKGLSEKYGIKKGETEAWLAAAFQYKVIARVHRDVILA